MVNLLIAERVFRDQYEIGLTRSASPQRQMPCVASHHFYDLHPPVRARRRARALYDLRDVAQSRVEAERVIRARQIFIDRLRDTDDVDAPGRKTRGHAQRILAAAGDDDIQTELGDILDHLFGAVYALALFVGRLEGIGSRRAEVGSAVAIPAAPTGAVERRDFKHRMERAAPSVIETDSPDAVSRSTIDQPLDRRIKAGRIPAAGQYADTLYF